MKNQYHIEGEVCYIHITNRKGELFYALVDVEDLKILQNNNFSWHVSWNTDSCKNCVATTIQLGTLNGKQKSKTLRLHNFLLSTNNLIDHINHEMLDNRKSNLRITNKTNNSRNRVKLNKTNKTGYRNICIVNDQYLVQLQVDGKNKRLGRFPLDQLDEAVKFAKEMREKYYGEFAGE